jgi:hypothetical protein
MPSQDFQVVILAGGECKRLYPLTSAGEAWCNSDSHIGSRCVLLRLPTTARTRCACVWALWAAYVMLAAVLLQARSRRCCLWATGR